MWRALHRQSHFFTGSAVVLVLLAGSSWTAPCRAQQSLSIQSPRQIAAERAIRQSLEKKTSFDIHELPLEKFAARLAQTAGVNIVLDRKAMEDLGVGGDTPVTLSVSKISLDSILSLALHELELTWYIAHEVVIITTPEQLEANLFIRVYPVHDLVMTNVSRGVGTNETGEWEPDFDSLIHIITTTVHPTDWEEVGGPGSIVEFENSYTLVIAQTPEVHAKIEALLVTLRRFTDRVPARARPKISSTGSTAIAPPRRAASRSRQRISGHYPAWRLPARKGSNWSEPSSHGGGGYFKVDDSGE